MGSVSVVRNRMTQGRWRFEQAQGKRKEKKECKGGIQHQRKVLWGWGKLEHVSRWRGRGKRLRTIGRQGEVEQVLEAPEGTSPSALGRG